MQTADIVMIIGTSMNVYPAAGLINHARRNATKYYIDPDASNAKSFNNLQVIKEKAGMAVPNLVEKLMQ